MIERETSEEQSHISVAEREAVCVQYASRILTKEMLLNPESMAALGQEELAVVDWLILKQSRRAGASPFFIPSIIPSMLCSGKLHNCACRADVCVTPQSMALQDQFDHDHKSVESLRVCTHLFYVVHKRRKLAVNSCSALGVTLPFCPVQLVPAASENTTMHSHSE